jgi:hypothetical protein
VRVLATFITRDGFRKREELAGHPPVFHIPRPPKIIPVHTLDKPAGMMAELNEIVTFRLDKVEKGVGDVVYATYREID